MAAKPWKVYARWNGESIASCSLLVQIAQMQARDRKDALGLLDKLLRVAANGAPFEDFYDKKQCHEAHRFQYRNSTHVVWRIRKNNVRLAFYYGNRRLVLAAQIFTKRRDKLTDAEKAAIEQEIKAYLDADAINQLDMRQP